MPVKISALSDTNWTVRLLKKGVVELISVSDQYSTGVGVVIKVPLSRVSRFSTERCKRRATEIEPRGRAVLTKGLPYTEIRFITMILVHRLGLRDVVITMHDVRKDSNSIGVTINHSQELCLLFRGQLHV